MLDKKVFNETDKKVFDEVVTLLMLGAKIDGFEYKGYMLNPDKKHVDLIIEGLKKKDRYCPCRVQKDKQKGTQQDLIQLLKYRRQLRVQNR